MEKIEETTTKKIKIKWKQWILFGSLVVSLIIFSYFFGDMIEPWGV